MIRNTLLKKIGLLGFLLWLCVLASTEQPTFSVAKPVEAAPKATVFNITYEGNWDPAAQAALMSAVDTWSTAVYAPRSVNITARWVSWGLGNGYAESYTQSGNMPNPNAYYPIIIYNARYGFSHSLPDAYLDFNSNISNWYFGLDGNTPSDAYDFETVALKAMAGAMGLYDTLQTCGPTDGCWGLGLDRTTPYIHDTFVINASGQHLTDTSLFPNPSPALRAEITSNNLYFGGPEAIASLNGVWPKLGIYPTILDEAAFPRGTANALLTETLETGEAIHDPGPLAKAIMYDLGWMKPRQAPVFRQLPSLMILVNTSHPHAIDLLQYISDADTPIAQHGFGLTDVVPAEAGVTVDETRYVSINPSPGWVGQATVTVWVVDSDNLSASQSFQVIVVPQLYQRFLPLITKP